MEVTRFGKVILFLLSYYPLFAFIICDNKNLKEIDFRGISLNWILVIVLTLFVILLNYYLFFHKKWPKKVFEITKFENTSAETLNYLISFMIGLYFIEDSLYSMKIIILLVLFYVVYQAGGTYYLQPILMLMDYKVYKCSIDNNNTVMVISKRKIGKNKIELEELFEDVYIFKGENDE
ncbi:hypothetical protein RE476_09570 [Methanolobus mangrovi]|uniref:Uncharacterized protein n=1 Tax=Methanolobus mangrovi TaxID=3072977 RepID=A0AA51YG48_9EURY|nr:hypothetical protein [Methanolobus mangrovi]WMW21631.1 hypothetical protein RE476_09570 [Methanolobus mangrovi]